ncbi:MAG: hypothetical protein V7618_11590 [Rhodoglobus sp.]
MSETGIVALAGVIATLFSGLGATWLTNRHATQRDAIRLRTEAQSVARKLIVDTLVEAREWNHRAMSASMVSAAADSLSVVDDFLQKEFSESETGRGLAQHGAALKRSLTEAQLLIADKPLSESLERLRSLHEDWWSLTIDPIRENFKSATPDKVERVRIWYHYDKKFTAAISDLETASREHIATSLKP